ncbi:MAG: response regulator [Acidobacteria bacterium]|nr:response regulator [Acidobacteriota bacterium]
MMALTSNEGVRVLVTGRTLLLADDSATIRKVVELTFSDEGFEVITVSDGQQALDKLEEIVPDIVLADVFMPEVNGYQVCEHIKQTERFRHIPVMLLVGSFEPFDEAEARRVGADDYLTKPFQSIRALVGKVRGLLGGEDNSSSSGSQEATTRKLAPLPERDEENRPDEESIKRSTADTAPLPQHEREEAQRTGDSSRENAFADLSMDDQMIEATPANDYSSSNSDSLPAQDTHEETRPTAAYSAADLKEAGISQAIESADASEQEGSVSRTSAPAQIGESSPAAAGGHSHSPGRVSNVASSEDALLDLGDIEPRSAAMTEADDFFLDLLDESPAQTRASAPSFAATPEPSIEATAAPSNTEELDADARTDYEEETAEVTSPSQAQEFVEEPQVVSEESRTEFAIVEDEASPVAEYQSADVASVSAREGFSADTQLAPTERLPDDFQPEEAPAEMADAESGATATASPVTGQITLGQLSPEVIDAIARRAVEQLSARVVEQIAWEVVPDLAELLIKRRLEQEKQ